MRILRLHAPGTGPALAGALGAAVAEFNGGLDIRLRFLSIGIEEEVVEVADAAQAAEALAAAQADDAPPLALVLLLGDGDAAVAAAHACARSGLRLVRIGAGVRDGTDADSARAVDRLATGRLTFDEAASRRLADEGIADGTVFMVGSATDAATAPRIVRALSTVRRLQLGDA